MFRLITKKSLAINQQVFYYNRLGSAKANGREPKTCSGRFFNYKLGCFYDIPVLIYVDARPHL